MKKTNKIPKYKFGGGFDSKDKSNVGNFFKNYGLGIADTSLNALGVDAIGAGKGINYQGNSANKFNQVTNVTGAVAKAAAPIVANAVVPGSGQLISAGQQMTGGAYNQFGPQNEQGFNGYDSQGNPIYNEGDKSGQIGNIAGQVGSMAGGFMNGQKTKIPEAMYGGTIQYGAGGIQYANGGNGQINAEVEKEENSVAPNGQFTQFNGPSHAAGGIKTDIPQNSLIFSDKLKMPGTKKTFADLNKSNNTNKEDKILSSDKHGNISKHTAMLMSMAKNKNSETLFANQEAFKQAKVQAYAKRMGVTLPSTDNEQMEPQGMSEQSEGEFAMGGVKLPMYQFGGPPVPSIPTFNNRSQFDNYYKTQGWAPDPRNQSGRNLNYYDPKKYAYNKTSDTFSNVGGGVGTDSTANFGSLPSSEFAEFKPGSGVVGIVNKTPSTANWQTNQLLRGGGNKLTYADGTTQMVDPKVVKTTGFKYGGMNLPKFGNGVKFTPKMAQEGEGDDVIIPGNNGRNSGFDPNEVMGPDPYNTFNKPDLDKWSANRLNKLALDAGSSTPDTPPPSNKFDWNNLANNVATFAANNAGNIYNLSRYNKPEVETYERVKPSYLDPTQAIKDKEYQYRQGLGNLKTGAGGNAATLLGNTQALRAGTSADIGRVRREYDNANSQIGNQNAQFNSQIAMNEVIANAQNRARNRSGKGEAIGSMGSNVANQMRDVKGDSMDQKTLDMMTQYYNNPEFRKAMEKSGFKIKK